MNTEPGAPLRESWIVNREPWTEYRETWTANCEPWTTNHEPWASLTLVILITYFRSKLVSFFLKTDEDFVFGAIYVPSSELRFNNQDELDIFEVEICKTCILYKYICLLGDFNARTHNKDDFLDVDDFFNDHFVFDHNVRNFYNLFCQN